MKIIRKLMPMIIIAVIIVVVDLLTKVWAERALAAGPIVLIPGVLEFSFLRNFGAAFGSLQGARFFFLIITAVFMAAVLYVTIKMPSDKKYRALYFCLALLAGGAVGNLIDRVFLGSVRDFIYFRLINFPVFNVADIAVTCSAFILVYLVLIYYKDEDFAFLNLKGKDQKHE